MLGFVNSSFVIESSTAYIFEITIELLGMRSFRDFYAAFTIHLTNFNSFMIDIGKGVLMLFSHLPHFKNIRVVLFRSTSSRNRLQRLVYQVQLPLIRYPRCMLLQLHRHRYVFLPCRL